MKAVSFIITAFAAQLTQISCGIDYQTNNGAGSQNQPHFKLMPEHYIDYPVSRKDFGNWETLGAAVTLRNRTVLAPETRDKKGIMYNVHPNQLTKQWMAEVELEIGNQKQSSRGGTGVALLYVKKIDDQVSHAESLFGYSNRYQGIGIYLNSAVKSERGSRNEITNAIQGFFNDGNRIVNVFQDKGGRQCYKRFRNLPPGQLTKLRVQYDSPLLTVQLFDHITESYDYCLSFEAPLDFPGYFVLTGASGGHNPDHVYLNSFKLYDPKTLATNDHFQDSRHAKVAAHDDIQFKIMKGVQDLFEKHSQKDLGNSSQLDRKRLIELIPKEYNAISHKIERTVSQFEDDDAKFFDAVRGIHQQVNFKELNEKFYTFRMAIDSLNQNLDQDLKTLKQYDRKLKNVRHQSGMQRGLTQIQVNNKHTKELQQKIAETDERSRRLFIMIKDYQGIAQNLGDKIRREGSGFTERLEEQRKRFAKEQSQQITYDMTEIDSIFDQMELTIKPTGLGAMMINIGMIIVIAISAFLWFKMRDYETKNA